MHLPPSRPRPTEGEETYLFGADSVGVGVGVGVGVSVSVTLSCVHDISWTDF